MFDPQTPPFDVFPPRVPNAIHQRVGKGLIEMIAALTELAHIDPNVVFAGLPFQANQIPDYVQWNDVVKLIEKLEDLAGGPEILARYALRLYEQPKLKSWMRLITSFIRPVTLFLRTTKFFQHAIYPRIYTDVQQIGPSEVRFVVVLHEGLQGCRAFFNLHCAVALSAAMVAGANTASMTTWFDDRRCIMDLYAPTRPSLLRQFFGFFRRDALIKTLIEQQQQLQNRLLLEEKARRQAEALQQSAERSLAVRDVFLQKMSHELRTPLNHIIGGVQLVHLDDHPLSPAVVEGLQVVENAAKTMLQMVDVTLQVAAAESAGLPVLLPVSDDKYIPTLAAASSLLPHEIHLDQPMPNAAPVSLLQRKEVIEVVEKLSAKASKKHLSFIYDISLSLDEDLQKYQQNRPKHAAMRSLNRKVCLDILQQLIDNAIKFTDAGFVQIQVYLSENMYDDDATAAKSTREAMPALVMRVQDSGMGIPQDEQERMFEPFAQLDESSTRKYDGMGLGLALVRHCVKTLDGVLTLHSQYGVGTQFVVKLPIFSIRMHASQPPVAVIDAGVTEVA